MDLYKYASRATREHRHTIDLISQAVNKLRTTQMRYYSASRDGTGRREVDPCHLWFAAGGLDLIVYCHLRKDLRLFAVERIRSIALNVMRGRRIEVELLFSKKAAG